jgi:predicted nuclease of predicted toxin-antitoxin system
LNYSFTEAESLLKESTVLYGRSDQSLISIVDAQLPKKLSDFLNSKGFNSIHTLYLPDKNGTSDRFIKEKSSSEKLVLITKDDDFLQSFLIAKKPFKLILVKTGNISNTALMDIFEKGLFVLTSLISQHPLIEITKQEIIVHN